MTFADKLKELRERATPGPSPERLLLEITEADSDLFDLLANNAAEIEALVRAAEAVAKRYDDVYGLRDALEALDK